MVVVVVTLTATASLDHFYCTTTPQKTTAVRELFWGFTLNQPNVSQQAENSAAFSDRGNILTKARWRHFIKITGDFINLKKRIQTRLTSPDSGSRSGPESATLA